MLQATSDPKDYEAANKKYTRQKKKIFPFFESDLDPNRGLSFSGTPKESEQDEFLDLGYIQELFDEIQPSSSVSSSILFDQSNAETFPDSNLSSLRSYGKPTNLWVDVNEPVDAESGSKNRIEKCLSNKYAIPFIVATVAIAYWARIYLHFSTKDF